MATTDTRYLSIAEVGSLLRGGEISAIDLTRRSLELIEAIDGHLHAFLLVTSDLALSQAAEADEDLKNGVDRGPLHGIPIGLKDLYATKGIRTTAHSRVLQDWSPEADSAAAESFQKAGAVLLGKLAMDELAFGITGPDHAFPQARNPWNLDHIPGGSSTGSGAALGAGLLYGALGSDTGGSIRNPAMHCGVVGIKPTFGRVSRRGVVPLSWSLDHAGPLARRVQDCAFVLQAISGYDAADPSSVNVAVPDFSVDIEAGIRGLRLGLPRDWLSEGEGLDPEVAGAFDRAAGQLQELGASVVEVPSEAFIDARAANSIISLSESFSYHEETLRTQPEAFTHNLRNRVREGAFVSASDYVQAQRARVAIRKVVRAVLADVDAIISPSGPAPPERFDAQDIGARFRRPSFSHPANLTGLPAISLPMGITASGLPMGLQVMGRAFDEAMLVRVGSAYEKATDWHNQHPPI